MRAIAYGMMVGIRSSRGLEEACRSRVDFMRLMEGRTPDHTTFSKCRSRHPVQIRELFRFLGRTALEMGLAREGGVEAYIPLEGRRDRPESPAHRADPTQPVPESDWPRLPRNPATKKLDRAAFLYDPAADVYYCPMGHRMPFDHKATKKEKNSTVANRICRCAECAGSPLGGACLSGEVVARTVSRDEHEGLREAMDARLRTREGRATHARRSWACETVFGCLKTVMRLRQFLLRGLDKVKTEWLWTCAAYNLRRLVRALGRQRGCRWAAVA